MRRFIALILSLSMILGCLFSLSGCSSSNDVLKMGQWLAIIADQFGMESYQQKEPYFDNVNVSDMYYDAFQMAAEWEIIKPNNEITSNDVVNWREAIVTAVNAGNFLDETATDEEKIDYAIKNIDTEIRQYWMNRDIKQEDAIEFLAKVQNAWATRKYTEKIEKVIHNDHVIDLTNEQSENYSVKANTVVFDGKKEIKNGDILILPSSENKFEKDYVKVASVNRNGDNSTVVEISDAELKLEDIYEELHLRETVIPTVENTVIYDGNGNVITMGAEVKPQSLSEDDYKVVPMIYTENDGSVTNCDAANVKHSFKTDGLEVSLGYKLNGALDLSVDVSSENLLSSDKFGEVKLDTGFEIKDLSVTHDFDWKTKWVGIIPVPTLNSAELKIDYETESKFGISYAGKATAVAAPKYSNGNGKFLTNFKRAVLKGQDSSGAKTIASKKQVKICSINVYNAGVAKICLDVNLTLSVDGSIEVTITESGAKGVEYKNGNIRFIKTSKRDVDAEAKAKIELTLGFGPALYVIGLEKRLVGVEVKAGVGAAASLKAHLADTQMHLIEELDFNDTSPEIASGALAAGSSISASAVDIQTIAQAQGGIFKAEAGAEVMLHIDWCLDVKVYGILSVGVTDQSFLVDVIGDSVNLSVSILNEKNATFFNIHVDNFRWQEAVFAFGANAQDDNCTFNFIPFDAAEKDEDSTGDENSNQDIITGEMLILSTMNINLSPGQKQLLNITQIPRGYKVEDIIFSSSDDKVAKVDKESGLVEAVGNGSAVITAKTKDGKYSSMAAVIIGSTMNFDFEGLSVNKVNEENILV